MAAHRLLAIGCIAVIGWARPSESFALGEVPGQGKSQEAAPAVLPPLVDVLDADPLAPIHYQVPKPDVERLLGQKAIVAPDNATGAGDYRFASADAAEKWFAAARPIVPPAGAKSPLQKLDFGFPISTGARVSFDAAGRPWFWERWSMPADQFKREVEEIAAGKQGLIPGEILLIDRDDRAWMVRSPSAANHICQPTKTKVSPDSR